MKNMEVLTFYKLINPKNTFYIDCLRNYNEHIRSNPLSHKDLSTSFTYSLGSNRSILGK